MFNRKGMTLVESLFALEIFLGILVIYVPGMLQMERALMRLDNTFSIQSEKILFKGDENPSKQIGEVLHSLKSSYH